MNNYQMNPIEYTLHWWAYRPVGQAFIIFFLTVMFLFVLYRAIRAAGVRAYQKRVRDWKQERSIEKFNTTQHKLRNR